MRAVHETLCLVIMAVHCVCADEVHRTVELNNVCAGSYRMDDALSSDTLYNQVYQWSHGRKISNWAYEPTAASAAMHRSFSGNPELQCVLVHYTADFDMPAVFAAFLHTMSIDTRIQIRVKKEVCVHAARVLVELATVSEHIVGDVHIETRSEIHPADTLKTVSNIAIDVPWYATFLNDHILESLSRSVHEKVDVVADSLCRPPLPSFSLRRVADRRFAPKRRHSLQPVY